MVTLLGSLSLPSSPLKVPSISVPVFLVTVTEKPEAVPPPIPQPAPPLVPKVNTNPFVRSAPAEGWVDVPTARLVGKTICTVLAVTPDTTVQAI